MNNSGSDGCMILEKLFYVLCTITDKKSAIKRIHCVLIYYLRNVGVDLVKKALKIPCFTISSNAGVDAQEVVQKVIGMSGSEGYDAMNSEYVDMLKTGIIDPTKVRYGTGYIRHSV